MLGALSIRDIVLIDRLDIDFSDGLTVLTGETGAGKSILLDSLSLALGGRGDGGLVRSGVKQGHVIATFDLPADHPVFVHLNAHDIDADGELVLRRVQSADGRTRAFVNDQPVSAGLLRDIGGLLVEIHGQHDDRALIDPASHRALLDSYGELTGLCDDVRKAFQSCRHLEKERDRLQAEIEAARREADYLRASVEELQTLAPEAGEEESLAERRQTMMNSEKIASDLNDAVEIISGNASPIPTISGLMRRLQRKAADMGGMLDDALEALDRSLNGLEDASTALEQALRDADFNPRELEEVEERLFALRAASRKYHVPVEQLPVLATDMAGQLETLDAGEERLDGFAAELETAWATYWSLAERLSEQRADHAGALAELVNSELPDLKLEAARFIVHHEADRDLPQADGIDQVAFWVQTNPGTKPGPMMKVASGGELSRFLLALKVVLADKASAPTLVFDEIDTGVGGAVAEAIGLRLARLAGRVQVLSITHAPQVAARAAGHMLIAKSRVADEERVATQVSALSGPSRREEIARMLAGATITEEARAAADRLMAGAGSA
ncbi:DNA repair protein RecN [Coralliovum pocilloporae]|uniref:DNA repair protein RecN n=1 Tax=Coralliovum pocilloporae TaxID=3066369 RepID=UPI003307711F